MSAVENLRYSARFHGLTGTRARGAIPDVLARVGFPPDRGAEPMENLSRGMQQKVTLARALLTTPVLVLLDEPTTGLDPRSGRESSGSCAICGTRTTRPRCCAPMTSTKRRCSPTGSGSSTGAAARLRAHADPV